MVIKVVRTTLFDPSYKKKIDTYFQAIDSGVELIAIKPQQNQLANVQGLTEPNADSASATPNTVKS